MNTRPTASLPLFELSIFLIVILVGWAAFRLSEILPQQNGVHLIPNPAAATEPARDSAPSLPDVIEKQDALKLRDELLGVADYVQSNFADLENAFGGYVDRRNTADLKRFDQKSREFRGWLEKQKIPSTYEQLDGKSHKLKERIASGTGSVATRARRGRGRGRAVIPAKNSGRAMMSEQRCSRAGGIGIANGPAADPGA